MDAEVTIEKGVTKFVSAPILLKKSLEYKCVMDARFVNQSTVIQRCKIPCFEDILVILR